MRWSCVVLMALLPTLLNADDFVLIEKGLAPAPIVLAKGTTAKTREAVDELVRLIEKICGSKPVVIEGEPTPQPERAIWVGVQPIVKELFPKTDFEFRHPEEILIVANPKHLVIAGRDQLEPGSDKQFEYGTVNAVYTFLQDHLGVRWFWPGELGEDVVKRDRVALPPFEYRYHPQIRSRNGLFHYSALGSKGYGRSHEWTRCQRLQLDSLSMEGGHGFGDWWDRYHEKHPEIFALQPDGTRSGFPGGHNAKLCMSNPKVWTLWLEQVAEKLKQNPTQTVFNASPNDGWASGHCVCPNCMAWDHPKGEPRVFNWSKKREERPALSDRDVTFANKLGALLKEKYPDKNYRVMMLSYGHSRPAPIVARPADNVIIAIVANFFGRAGLVDRGSTRGDTYRQQFEAWAKIVPSMFWRPNTGSPAGWQQGLPDLSTQQTIRDLKDVAAAHCEGVFFDAVWEHWATQGPQLYIMAQLVWNPSANADSILTDYYQRAFGPAAAVVREYFEAIEKARMTFTAKNTDASFFSFPQLFNEELLRDSQSRLDRAKASLPSDSMETKRVAFVQAGLDYTKLTIENIRLMSTYWKKKDEVTAAQVRKNWVAIEKLVAANPHTINWGPVRPITPRMSGLHPDYVPMKGKGLRAIELDK